MWEPEEWKYLRSRNERMAATWMLFQMVAQLQEWALEEPEGSPRAAAFADAAWRFEEVNCVGA